MAYAAFRFYRDLGEQRSAVKVREQCGISLRLVERWSSVHAWVLRTRLWDEHQDRISVAVSTDTIQTMRLEHAEWGRSVSAGSGATAVVAVSPPSPKKRNAPEPPGALGTLGACSDQRQNCANRSHYSTPSHRARPKR